MEKETIMVVYIASGIIVGVGALILMIGILMKTRDKYASPDKIDGTEEELF